ncbi:hypothetical protein YC2023_044268 [Brassica napus]
MRPFIDDAELATTRRILVHVQSHATLWYFPKLKMLIICGGPVMKLYLWDQAAVDFCKKFKHTCSHIHDLLTGLFDYEVQPTKEYIDWYV